ncbi:16S rRNA (cytosine(967)-C(5))-methyltransferase RsmB [Paenibacillus whitsoniae]|uniref:16S rRNA (cytosine(967)-C(5))-methyltransferase n=1 Tax=Paenibacillus whitsoniae TaxID=2496558 RepID=A0A3S0A3I7_9BACL|nr:16S rRNA (cytosine(967)-C(5))-methyltransferase RsmB [Paenibacillus whitsoniae]RTE08670.1 16S rRNA (cytosine(967)-C(5))-methyltransferase RsmB [Paenibacillus whitsoniae]
MSTTNRTHGKTHKAATASPSAAKSSAVRHSAREAALDVLVRVEENQAYSNLLLNQVLQKHALPRADAGLATELVYGTIGRKNTIDFFLERFVSKGLAKLEPWVRCLLRLSFYQLYYLDRIPDHAVVSEAVNIAKRRGHQGISGMVNGVLRAVLRSKAELALPAALGDVKRIALGHSHPEWLVRRWIRQLGAELTEQICAANNVPPHVSIRANARRLSRAELLRQLEAADIRAEASLLAPAGVLVHGAGNMALVPGFGHGDFSIQDESSMLVAEALDPRPGMTVLDCCAAPGGKTAHIAEKMGDTGKIWACDLHEHKRKLIDDQAERLGLSSIETLVMDATELDRHFAPASFDRILLDAPCSGFGVIRRKPDLKWAKQEAEIAAIAATQHAILERVHRLLKPGGVLVYSTCTIEHEENAGMIERFLADHPEFELAPLPAEAFGAVDPAAVQAGMVQILPQQFHSDGFFIARLRKREASS